MVSGRYGSLLLFLFALLPGMAAAQAYPQPGTLIPSSASPQPQTVGGALVVLPDAVVPPPSVNGYQKDWCTAIQAITGYQANVNNWGGGTVGGVASNCPSGGPPTSR